MDERLVELVARALCRLPMELNKAPSDTPFEELEAWWNEIVDRDWRMLRPFALAAIAAINASGIALVVPVKCPWDDDPFEPLSWNDMIAAYLAEQAEKERA